MSALRRAIKVRGRTVDPFEDIEVPSHLELPHSKLRDLERRIQEKHTNFIERDAAFFSDHGRESFGSAMCELHKRSLYSSPSSEGKVVMAKGTGVTGWRMIEFPLVTGNAQSFPVVVRKEWSLAAHKYWGGESLERARYQYVTALILLALAERHHIEPPCYTPLGVVQPLEFPVQDNSGIRFVPDYSNGGELMNDGYRLPEHDELCELGQLFYIGKAINYRISLWNSPWSPDAPTSHFLSPEQLEQHLTQSAVVVHSYNGAFSDEYSNGRFSSSLSSANVSISGQVCDLDTVSFELSEPALSAAQSADMRAITATVKRFKHAHRQLESSKVWEGIRVRVKTMRN